MKKQRPKRTGILFLLVLVVLIAVPLVATWWQVRQERLDHALLAAVKRSDTAAIVSALDRGANPNAGVSDEEAVSFMGRLQGMIALLVGKSSSLPETASIPVLLHVVEADDQENRLAIVEALIQHEADVNVADANGYTPLWYATAHGDDRTMLLLLDHHAAVDRADRNGYTPLMHVADGSDHRHDDLDLAQQIRLIKLLLSRAADVNARNLIGQTALMVAANVGNAGVATLLLAKGSDPNAKDKAGWSALMFAAGQEPGIAPDEAAIRDTVNVLLDGGADVNTHLPEGDTALMQAIQHGHPSVVKAILSRNPDVNAKNQDGETALEIASDHDDPETVKDLLAHGANAKCEAGQQAFEDANLARRARVVALLKAAGAKP